MVAAVPFIWFSKLPGSLTAGALMILPLIADGSLQFAGLYESTNFVRMLTGFLAGTGVCVVFEAGIRDG
jgi:uncharacterized membrane protein